ncbi:AAA family ATPase [Candidatus Parcubacteria bacterium]|nr:AAA family ATPase [Candidatus Parcubacteria bacterium]
MKIIVGLVGEIASGKGTIAEYLEKKYSASTYKFSSILRDVLIRLHIEISRKNMQNLSTILRQNFGEDLLARIIAEDVKKDGNKIIVVDGIRRMADIKYLKEIAGFKLIKITADSKIRYERLIERTENQGDTKKTYEEFLSDHNKEADAKIPKVLEKAEIEINNNGAVTELYQQVDKIIKQN